MGVQLAAEPPAGASAVSLRDVDLETLARALAPYGVAVPGTVAVAVQDHGFSPHASNRLFRFAFWRRFVEEGGEIADLLYQEPPESLTRMRAVREDAPGAYVMDTGAAAIWGALCDESVAARREAGLVILNVGNAHTIAVLLRGSRVQGLFEHHTGALSGAASGGAGGEAADGHADARGGLRRGRPRRLPAARLHTWRTATVLSPSPAPIARWRGAWATIRLCPSAT